MLFFNDFTFELIDYNEITVIIKIKQIFIILEETKSGKLFGIFFELTNRLTVFHLSRNTNLSYFSFSPLSAYPVYIYYPILKDDLMTVSLFFLFYVEKIIRLCSHFNIRFFLSLRGSSFGWFNQTKRI